MSQPEELERECDDQVVPLDVESGSREQEAKTPQGSVLREPAGRFSATIQAKATCTFLPTMPAGMEKETDSEKGEQGLQKPNEVARPAVDDGIAEKIFELIAKNVIKAETEWILYPANPELELHEVNPAAYAR